MRTFFEVKRGSVVEVKGPVVREQPLTVYVNGDRFLTLLCSPMQLEALVLGYLWMEKVIGSLEDVTALTVSEVDGRADVTLSGPVTLPTERILTSGCGGGITFRIDPRLFSRLDSKLRVRPADLSARMKDLFSGSRPLPGVARYSRRRARRPRPDPPPRRGRGPAQCRGQAQGRGAAARDLDHRPHPALHRPRLLRDAPQGRADGRAPGGVAHVAHRDGGGTGRAARRHRGGLSPSGQPQPLRGRGAGPRPRRAPDP